jgi:hypothetical protein
MKWVLVILVLSGTGKGVATATFQTEELCRIAAETLTQWPRIKSYCFKRAD